MERQETRLSDKALLARQGNICHSICRSMILNHKAYNLRRWHGVKLTLASGRTLALWKTWWQRSSCKPYLTVVLLYLTLPPQICQGKRYSMQCHY